MQVYCVGLGQKQWRYELEKLWSSLIAQAITIAIAIAIALLAGDLNVPPARNNNVVPIAVCFSDVVPSCLPLSFSSLSWEGRRVERLQRVYRKKETSA